MINAMGDMNYHKLDCMTKRVTMLAMLAMAPLLAVIRAEGTTKVVFTATSAQLGAAITNAFGGARYHYMFLNEVPYRFDTKAHVWSTIKATNEWSIVPSTLPLAFVPKGKKTLPYSAEFDIRTSQIATNEVEIVVTTISSYVFEGKGTSIHGVVGANPKKVPPVIGEETNVLLEIRKALLAVESGDNKPLPPTPDIKAANQYQLQQVKKYNPDYEKMLRQTLATTNATSGK
jgi:hypothetical protein